MTTTREALLEAGLDLFLRRAYQGTGIADILAQAGVPKGSFYHYFPSKEHFALAVLAMHRERVELLVEHTLRNPALPYPERIRNFLRGMTAKVIESDFMQGCPVGTFGQEMAASSKVLRTSIEAAFHSSIDALGMCIAEGQTCGAFRADITPDDAARYIHSAMHGAIIVAKAERGCKPIDVMIRVTVDSLLISPKA